MAVRMSLRTCATLALLLGLMMWALTSTIGLAASVFTTLVFIHIALALGVLILSIVVLFLPAPATGNIRLFQAIVVLLTICTMLVGLLQYLKIFDGIAATLTHLILALAVVGLIETTLARQNRIARAARSA
ncbi:MAG TPA: hypothetical protein VFN02_06360 [Ktedonobacteraceae bacterium]|nr:hypothetical protein [Ktedonobacteraceae bacterium]